MFKLILTVFFSLILIFLLPVVIFATSHDDRVKTFTCDSVKNFSATPMQGTTKTTFRISGQIVNCKIGSGLSRIAVYSHLSGSKPFDVSVDSLNTNGEFIVTGTFSSQGRWELAVRRDVQNIPVDNKIIIAINPEPGSPTATPQSRSSTDCIDLPGNFNAPCFPGLKAGFKDLGSFVTNFMDLVLALVGLLAFLMLVYGALRYIFAGGDKQGLQSARQRMIYAIIGLIVVALAFALTQFIEQVLAPNKSSPISIYNLQFTIINEAYAQTVKSPLAEKYDFGGYQNLGHFISTLLPTIFSIAALGVVFYFLLGAFKWLSSGGNKEGISSARGMITHSIIGFFLLMMIFLIMQFLPEFLGINLNIFAP